MKVVFDTCIYIDYLRAGLRDDLVNDRGFIRYLSPIVLMELRAGTRNLKQARFLDGLFEPYSRAQRIIQLSSNHFYQAGECLANFKGKPEKVSLSHDILVACSALAVGATLFTANKKDFQAIQKWIPAKMQFV